MYMALILKKDVAITNKGFAVPYAGDNNRQQRMPDVLPSDPSYPKPYNNNKATKSSSGFGGTIVIDNRLIQIDLGNIIWGRINNLHKEIFGSLFFARTIIQSKGGYEHALAAEKMGQKIQKAVYPNLSKPSIHGR